jgi:hypothetical protein
MFLPKRNTYVDNEISKITSQLQDLEPKSEEYDTLLNRLEKLHKMRQDEKPDQLSSDTLALVAANLFGILLIIRHEHVNVISSKAMGTLIRPR